MKNLKDRSRVTKLVIVSELGIDLPWTEIYPHLVERMYDVVNYRRGSL